MDSRYRPVDKPTKRKGHTNSTIPRKKVSSGRPWFWHVIGHSLSILWLAPAIILLYLNLTNYVIGNTLWCPSGHCNVQGDSSSSVQEALKHDANDHNVNGALLFAQKGVEVWFTMVATLLVFDLAMIFARREGGLPVGYLLAHLEFTDALNVLNPYAWTSAFSKRSNTRLPSNADNSPRVIFFLFAILIAFLTIITNLMGPAGGTLVLPTVQWTETRYELQEQFQGLRSADSLTALPDCTPEDLESRDFSCTNYTYVPMLEALVSSVIDGIRNDNPAGVVGAEANLLFTVNGSVDQPNLVYVMNRQALRSLSAQIFEDDAVVQSTYNDSIQAIGHRSGPLIGLLLGSGAGIITVVNISPDKQVRCMEYWQQPSVDPKSSAMYTKCIRLGRGWSTVNAATSFTINNETVAGEPQNDIIINTFFSDKATYFNDTQDFGSGLLACSRSSYSGCDWDAIFSTRLPPGLDMVATNSLVVETSRRNSNFSAIWVDMTCYLSFVDYQLNLSPNTHLDPSVTTANTSVPVPGTDSLVINPDWLLAAWSTKDAGIINGTSALGLMMASVLEDTNQEIAVSSLLAIQIVTIVQALTLVPYDFINRTGSLPGENPENVHFYYWRSRRVWMYSLSSRSARLGVGIICIGMVVVVMRTLLAIYQKLRYNHVTHARSPAEFIVSSLAHQPEGEFDHSEGKLACAQVRFRIDDDGEKFLRFKAQKTKTLSY